MSAPLLETLPTTIADRIKVAVPSLKQCEAYAGPFDVSLLKSTTIRAPAVLVSMIKIKQGDGLSGPRHHFDIEMAAYIVTSDERGRDRDAAAAQIGQTILTMVPDAAWGEADCGDARDATLRTLVGKSVKGMRLGLWAVTWTQPVVLTPLPASAPADIDLVINGPDGAGS